VVERLEIGDRVTKAARELGSGDADPKIHVTPPAASRLTIGGAARGRIVPLPGGAAP
jgi:hypothetical protein